MKRALRGVAILFLVSSVFPVPAQAQSKIASHCRFDLLAGASVGVLTNALILSGDGSIERQWWRSSSSEHPRSYSINLSVLPFAWTEFKVQFTAQKSGTVTLTLMGEYEAVPGSSGIYLQEVFWDALEATGARILNGSFETIATGGTIANWTGGVSQQGSAAVPAVHGSRYARTWHDRPLSSSFSVSGGEPVTLKFYSRAVVPPSFTEMKRITDRGSPAHQAALQFMRGVNLGNYLEAPPNSWGNIIYTEEDFRLIRNEGFDHVRIPTGWQYYLGAPPDYTLSNRIFTAVDTLVNLALKYRLGVILNVHLYDAFSSNPLQNTNQFYAIWRQVAAHYANAPRTVAFELLNEPKDKATTLLLNSIYPEVIGRIRQSNPNRTIFVAPGNYNSPYELVNLRLPDTDANLVATVHIYDPFYFTHQGAEWVGNDASTTGVIFPGPPPTPLALNPKATAGWVRGWFEGYNGSPAEFNPSSPHAFRGKIQRLRQWSDYFGRPVHVSEFGCYAKFSDARSRVNFYREIRKAMDAQGLGWAMWDWKAGFHYIENGRPAPPGMRDALFPPVELKAPGKGTIEFDAAVGKTFLLEKTFGLTEPRTWRSLSTQTLTTPIFFYVDAGIDSQPMAFYRVQWLK